MIKLGKARWGILAALAMSELLVTVDSTVFGLAIPSITQDLRPSLSQLLWMNDVYPLLLAALLLTSGSISDRFGRKKILLLGFLMFVVNSLFAAWAPTPELLIAARAGTAIGGAMIMPAIMSITRVVFPDRKERTLAIAVLGAVLSIGAALGPLLGGFLLEHFTWHAVFLINVPVIAVATLVVLRFVPESRASGPGGIDVLGSVLSVLGIGCLVLCIKTATSTGFTLTAALLLLGGIVVLSGLIAWLRRAPHPLLDLNMFRNRGFSTGVGSAGVAMLAMSGVMFVLEQLFQSVLHYSPMRAGFALLPLLLAIVLSTFVGMLMLRWGHRLLFGVGLGLTSLSLFGSWLALEAGGYLPIAAMMVALGAGIGLTMIAANDAVLTVAHIDHVGSAAATEETTYELGIGVGITVMGGIAFSVYSDSLRSIPGISEDTMNAARESASAAVAEAATLPPELATRLLADSGAAFIDGIQLNGIIGGVLVAVVTVAACALMPRHITAEDEAEPRHEDDVQAPAKSSSD
ncbi:MFS transporter [Allokutzneria multivorans]|uniref:MFS transporter n=1 Tax=Allokutzneria multivorans TaxID=1142134 RepID=A0ABP7T9Y7_9PSEU